MGRQDRLRIAHVADAHHGAGYAHGDEDAGGVNSRLDDFEEAWCGSCEQMIEEKVDLVAFAGDAFDSSKRGPTEEAAFARGLEMLVRAGIKVRGVTGNHDSPRQVRRKHALEQFNAYKGGDTWFADGRLVDDKPPVLFEGPEQLGLPLAIAYLPWINPAHLNAADPEYRALDMDARNAYLTDRIIEVLRGLGARALQSGADFGSILIAHGTVSNAAVGDHQQSDVFRDAVLPLAELRGLPFRYQAWGHLHRAQELDPHIRYSGSIERHDYGEAREDKGWWLVELGQDSEYWVKWRSSNPRPFLSIDLERPQDWQTELACFASQHDLRGAVLRVRYTTTPEIHATIDRAGIREMLRQAGVGKLYGPIPTIIRAASIKVTSNLSETTGVMEAWLQHAAAQGIQGPELEDLQHLLADAIEVTRCS
jgi:exonuclease SbcD